MRLLLHNRRSCSAQVRVAAFCAGYLLAGASACDFDERSNAAYGCGRCEAPDLCVDNFCIRDAGRSPARDAATGTPAQRDAAPPSACEPGTSELCYEGPAGSDEHPPCRFGRRTCSEQGVLGPCRGQITPAEESCNDVDDDCDGTTDEQLTRDARVCVAGRYVCDEPSAAVAERCDGADNDCDGLSDEGFDLSSDPLHCGGCGSVCAETERCCDGRCVDSTRDDDHCGACGMRCSRGTTCCGGACVDTSSDSDHCGACDQRCAGTGTCCDGQCVDAQTDRDHCGPFCLRCAEGEACCFGACADLDTFQHCGSCERVCGAGELCCSGSCTTSACE